MSPSIPTPSLTYLFRHPVQWLAFGLGSGLAPKAPGTFGTLAAIPFYWLMRDLPLPVYLLVLAAAFGVGIYFCDATARAQQLHDHPGIVWDEWVGYWLTMAFAPPGWGWVAVGFLLFRFFDILKPQPIGWLDRRVKGGFGIMLDDSLAAVYAGLLMQGLAYGLAALA